MKRRAWLSITSGVAVFLTAILLSQIAQTPSLFEIKRNLPTTDRVVLDRSGQIVDDVRSTNKIRRLAWVELKEVSPFFIQALLASEQSALTKQLAQLMAPDTREGRRPWLEALALSLKWSKKEILEAYLNLVTYRGELQGLAAASFSLFDKKPSSLSRTESAVLVALIEAPVGGPEELKAKACAILQSMGTPEDCGLLTKGHLAYIEQAYRIQPFIRLAPVFSKHLATDPAFKNENMIRSTLDREIQWMVFHTMQNEGSVVVLENATGNILAYHQGDPNAEDQPAGPMLQALIFAKAIDEKILTAASLLENSPPAIPAPFRDFATVREALSSGFSIPAVKALDLVGAEVFARVLVDLGFQNLQRANFYGPSLALGSVDVRLLELTNAYRALANRGVWSPVRRSPDLSLEETSRRVFSEEAAFVVSDILAAHQGSAHWRVGFSDQYTVGVWAASSQVAQPVWQQVMKQLHQRQPARPFRPPGGVVRASGEWFIAGTEPNSNLQTAAEDVRTKILYPQDGGLIALDPKLPRSKRRFFIQVGAPKADQNVYLNERRLGRAKSLLPWEPTAGHYVLEIRDSKGQVADRVSFAVRGRWPLAYNQ